MCSYKDACKLKGLSSSLEDSPCISVCELTYATPANDRCVCGRKTREIADWNKYDSTTKKRIVMECIKNPEAFPRQKLTFICDTLDITFQEAKKRFVVNK
tara:strand:- start:337 stop:636 length:300 start_codon:yes stop_codon:yes gene_type:complete